MTRTPIQVGVPAVVRHLRVEGFVYTFRRTQRTTGDVWLRPGRTEPKIAEGVLVRIGRATEIPDLRLDWAQCSGFASRTEWVKAIRDVHGGIDGYVYLLGVTEWTVGDGEAVGVRTCPNCNGRCPVPDRIDPVVCPNCDDDLRAADPRGESA